MKILFLGEILGRPGRTATRKLLPKLKKEYSPDFVVANVENLAHGLGITPKTFRNIEELGIDAFTSGNHIFDKKEGVDLIAAKKSPILRPANYPPDAPGRGYRIFSVRTQKILLVNLMGRVFIEEDYDCPFRKWMEIKRELGNARPPITLIDFHAEATSEKIAFGLFVDGEVSAVIGTHTHVPTQDFRILPKGTAYLSDIGMIGPLNSVLGLAKENIIKQFITQIPQSHDVAEEKQCEFNALYLEIEEKTGKARKISKIYKIVDI